MELEYYIKTGLEYGIPEDDLCAERFPTRIVSPNQRDGVLGMHPCIELASASKPRNGTVIRVALLIQPGAMFEGMPSAEKLAQAPYSVHFSMYNDSGHLARILVKDGFIRQGALFVPGDSSLFDPGKDYRPAVHSMLRMHTGL